MFEAISIITVSLLCVYIVSTLFHYTREGDINNVKPKSLFNDTSYKNAFYTLHQTIEVDRCKVTWPCLMAIAIVCGIILTHIVAHIPDSQSSTMLVIATVIFTVLYVNTNFINAHGGSRLLNTANQIRYRLEQ